MSYENPFTIVQNTVLNTIRHKGKYKKHYLSRNPFIEYEKPLKGIFEYLFTGREKEIKDIGKFIVEELQSNKEDMAVVGPKGCGSRTIVNFIGEYFLRNVIQKKDVIPEIQILKNTLAEVDDREVCFIGPNQRERLGKKMAEYSVGGKSALITSFFCDEHIFPLDENNRYNEPTIQTYGQLLNIDAKVMGEIVFLSAWHGSTFTQFYMREPQLSRKYEELKFIEPMTNKDIIELLKKRIKYCKIKEEDDISPFTNKAINKIAIYSGGFPRFALEFSYRILKNAIDNKLEEITEKDVKKYFNIAPQEEYMYDLLPYDKVKNSVLGIERERNKGQTLKKILETIIGLGGKQIVSADIADRLKLTRPATHKAFNRLKDLERDYKVQILIESIIQNDARKKPFELNPFFWSVFEYIHIMPELKRLWNNQETEWLI